MRKKSLQEATLKIPVTNYLDVKEYLRALYLCMKSSVSPYSYQLFAEDLGFAQTNVIRLVIAGKRKLSEKSAKTIAASLNLRKVQRRYFLALVESSHALAPAQTERSFQALASLKKEAMDSELDKKRMEYYSQWYFPVVRELIRLLGHVPDEAWLEANMHTRVFPEQVKKAIELLQSINLLRVDKNTGQVQEQSEEPLMLLGDSTAGEMSVFAYHHKMMDIAAHALVHLPDTEREFNSVTLCLAQESFEELRAKIQDLCADALALEKKRATEGAVVQLNIQLFSLTRPIRKSSEST